MALYSRSKYALRTNTPASTLTSCKQMVKTSESASLNTILKKNWGRNCASASIAPQRKTLSITAVITRVIIMQNLYDPPDLCGIDTESSLRLSSISTFHSTSATTRAAAYYSYPYTYEYHASYNSNGLPAQIPYRNKSLWASDSYRVLLL